MDQKVFIHCAELDEHPYPDSCPFKTCRAGMVRKQLGSMGLLTGPDRSVAEPISADEDTLRKFHQQEYLEALKCAGNGQFEMDMLHMGLGTGDCPVFHGLYDYATLAAGATVTGAKLILEGKVKVAFNPSGGYHHAFSDRAGGFCYINDVVLGCMTLAEAGKRVLFLDIDVHHCDGVQTAFYGRDDIMTISTHQDGRTLFPGTGFIDEVGSGEGKGYSVNFPLPMGVYDEIYLEVIRQGVLPLIGAYDPDMIVMEIGVDTLAGDPLAGFSLTNNVHADVINEILAFGKSILATGGGGYNVDNTVRAWALAWTALCGDQQDHDIMAGMGGVMMETMDWQGGAGLRDRTLIPTQEQRESVGPFVKDVIEQVKKQVFPLHGL